MKKSTLRFYLSVLALIIMFSNKGTGSENFAELAIGSKSYAMGQTATVSYSDLFSSINFPANLYQSTKFNGSFYYSSPVEDTKNMRFGFSIPLKGRGTIGFNYFRFIVNNIDLRNNYNQSMGTSSYIQHEYVISYGRNFSDNLLFGLNAKWLADELLFDSENQSGQKNIGFDFSVGYLPKLDNTWLKGLGFGFTLKNFIQLNTDDAHIPKQYRLIAENSFNLKDDTIILVMNYLWYENFRTEIEEIFHAGIGYIYKNISLRAGYNKELFTFGGGVNIHHFTLDYGYGSYQNRPYLVNNQHNFTISVQF